MSDGPPLPGHVDPFDYTPWSTTMRSFFILSIFGKLILRYCAPTWHGIPWEYSKKQNNEQCQPHKQHHWLCWKSKEIGSHIDKNTDYITLTMSDSQAMTIVVFP